MSDQPTVQGMDMTPERLPAGTGRADSALHRLAVGGKPFFVLRQRGRFADIAYDHGRLMAREIEQGVFPEILSAIARGTDLGDQLKSGVAQALFRGFSNRVAESVSEEFREAIGALADGYRAALPNAQFSRQQVVDAVIAIELDNLADGIQRRLALPSLSSRVSAAAEALALCAHDHPDPEVRALIAGPPDVATPHVTDAVVSLVHQDNRTGFACTGFSLPAGRTGDGRHVHARNLDADLYDWNVVPTLFLIDETDGHPDWHRYVAFGTAGLIYPGGISGLNDAGIAVSLHQLSSTHYRTQPDGSNRMDIAPFVQQRVLREAGSLEEAVEIVRTSQPFSAWVIFCSDAAAGRARRVEFNGETMRIGPVAEGPMVQTNHFCHPDLIEHMFDDSDAHFTPTFGKWLETRSRFAMVERALAEGAARNIDGAIDLLASGRDWQLVEVTQRRGLDLTTTGVERSFGRVPRKAYGQLGSIVRGDPTRRPGRDEAWMTIGDRLPACQSLYLGWSIDWTNFALTPVADRPLRRTRQFADSNRANWESSFEAYRAARVAFARPRDAAGTLLNHAADATQQLQDTTRAEALLSEAIEQAVADRIIEVPYYYMRARIRHQLGRYDAARQDWDVLRTIWGDLPSGALPVASPRVSPLLHEYEAALVLALSVATEDRLRADWGWDGRLPRLQEALRLLAELRERLFGADHPAHFDLVAWQDRITTMVTHASSEIEFPEPNFVTVE
ncbi:MAG TPA: C45 family autoproteolytic acyltransferase/hydrolase [Acetobacteraceae bacterium]|nr:C45 family autoproteolytic acyltransferase/hydrolase [Acetobacteraceae bacterium]